MQLKSSWAVLCAIPQVCPTLTWSCPLPSAMVVILRWCGFPGGHAATGVAGQECTAYPFVSSGTNTYIDIPTHNMTCMQHRTLCKRCPRNMLGTIPLILLPVGRGVWPIL